MPQLNHALLGVGLTFSEQGLYVKKDNMGNEIIKVANLLEPGFFPKEDLENYATPGVAMILELPSTVRAPAAMHDLIMMDRALEQRGVLNVRLLLESGDQFAGAVRFGAALIGEPDIHPSGEEVLLVPFRVAVAQQNQGVSHNSSVPRIEGC